MLRVVSLKHSAEPCTLEAENKNSLLYIIVRVLLGLRIQIFHAFVSGNPRKKSKKIRKKIRTKEAVGKNVNNEDTFAKPTPARQLDSVNKKRSDSRSAVLKNRKTQNPQYSKSACSRYWQLFQRLLQLPQRFHKLF